ncbi:phosphonate C-P lyase system protein PhnH [Mesorhizobium sp. SB112]|uniref:phosphonate C-P lyase system protein PhnH n=1 Tax=Mesorhizobium sp. SB112 TaxID=3151853 RepID=UPI00326433E0
MGELHDNAAFEGGFADPVFGSQAVFREVMEAMANPGRIVDAGDVTRAPTPLSSAASAFLATFADHDTPAWFEDADCAAAKAWLSFQTGAPEAGTPSVAAFAVLAMPSAIENWSHFSIGNSSYPDRSATLLLPVEALHGGSPLKLTGPGIETSAMISPIGLPAGFRDAMARNATLFPLGFDLILHCGTALLALPRTTQITEV